MSDAVVAPPAVAPAAAKSTKKTPKPKKAPTAKKPQPKPSHPTYKIMIAAAIKHLKDRKGSSRQAIAKYINAQYKVGDEKKAGTRLRLALRKAVDAGDLKQIKGSGASGSFRLAKDDKGTVTKASTKTGTAKPAKKPAAKKASKLKKPVTKKTKAPKKPAVKKAKKPIAKSPPKKAAPSSRGSNRRAKK